MDRKDVSKLIDQRDDIEARGKIDCIRHGAIGICHREIRVGGGWEGRYERRHYYYHQKSQLSHDGISRTRRRVKCLEHGDAALLGPTLAAFAFSAQYQQHADKDGDSGRDEESSHRLAPHVLDDVLRNPFNSIGTVVGLRTEGPSVPRSGFVGQATAFVVPISAYGVTGHFCGLYIDASRVGGT
jgi:hypothetical protein